MPRIDNDNIRVKLDFECPHCGGSIEASPKIIPERLNVSSLTCSNCKKKVRWTLRISTDG